MNVDTAPGEVDHVVTINQHIQLKEREMRLIVIDPPTGVYFIGRQDFSLKWEDDGDDGYNVKLHMYATKNEKITLIGGVTRANAEQCIEDMTLKYRKALKADPTVAYVANEAFYLVVNTDDLKARYGGG